MKRWGNEKGPYVMIDAAELREEVGVRQGRGRGHMGNYLKMARLELRRHKVNPYLAIKKTGGSGSPYKVDVEAIRNAVAR
jgi:hypothetical protein